MSKRPSSLTAFFLLTFAITWGIAALLLLFPVQLTAWFGALSAHHPLFFLAVWAPTIAAITLTAATQGWRGVQHLLSRLVQWRFGLQWYLVLLLGMPALGLWAVLVGGGRPVYAWSEWYLYLPALISQLFLDPGALGEELGWRGFALPRLLARFSPLWASLILGAIWFTWHLPAFFISGTPQSALSLPAFLLSALALSILATWLYQSTQASLVPSLLLHLLANFALNQLGATLIPFGGLLAMAALLVVLATRGALSTPSTILVLPQVSEA